MTPHDTKLPILSILLALHECRSMQAVLTIGDLVFQDPKYSSEELAQVSEGMEERKAVMS